MISGFPSQYIRVTIPARPPTVTATEKIVVVTFQGIGTFFAPSAEIKRLIHGERANLALHPLPGAST